MPPRKSSTKSALADAKAANQRVNRELIEYKRCVADHAIYNIETVNDDVFNLKGHLYGPIDSPFQGGVFKLEVKIPNCYPHSPPTVKFVTRIWHPNVSSQTGAICLDILKDKWSAALTLRTVMLSLQALLTSPEPDDPQDAMVARQYKEDNGLYKRTASYWTFLFAIEPKPDGSQFADFEDKIKQLIGQASCDRGAAISALSCNNWDIEAAARSL